VRRGGVGVPFYRVGGGVVRRGGVEAPFYRVGRGRSGEERGCRGALL
jgi:hypothetical protein